MWASMLHLVFGNAVIGLTEGVLLSWMLKCSKRKSVLILIAANYASAWAGGFFVAGYLPSLVDITILNVESWFLAFVCVAFVVTIFIELPFFWFALGFRENGLRRIVKATLAVNVISYVFLFGWYWMASGTSMMSKLEVVPVDEIELSEPYTLYFISCKGDQVLRLELSELVSPRLVSEVSADRDDRLFARARDNSGFDLLVCLGGSESEVLILEDFSEQAPIEWRISEGHSEKAAGTWFNFGFVPSIGAASDWEFSTGFWPIGGLRCDNYETREALHFSLELPFAAWAVRNATHITGDYIVAQIGDDQICIIDPMSRRIALIARGMGPLVAKPKSSN